MEITLTLVPFVGVWSAMYALMSVSYLLTLLLVPVAACLMVRLFIIQHDCGHRAMFSSRKMNNWVGRVMGVLTMTPYEYWRYAHSLHHAGSGNLDKRGFGDIDTLTIAEYNALTPLGKFRYRLYRNPIILFVLGPAYLFIVRHRFPVCALNLGRDLWISIMATNISIAVLYSVVIYFTGLTTFLMIQTLSLPWAHQSVCGCFMCNTNSTPRNGTTPKIGNMNTLHCMAVHSMIYPSRSCG